MRRLWPAAALAALGAVFYAPYWTGRLAERWAGHGARHWAGHLLAQRSTASYAYLFGFDPRVALVLLVLGAAALALGTDGLEAAREPRPARVSRKALGVALGVQAAACATMLLALGRAGGFGESTYDIDRLWLLAQGKRPYVDFEWPFGVAPLYVPLAAMRGLHLSAVAANYVFWFGMSLAGVWMLAKVIDRIDLRTERKTTVFVLIFVAELPLVLPMGAHYSLVRFTAALWSALEVHRAGTTGRAGLAAVLAVGNTALLLLLSPEMAIGHAFACAVMLFPVAAPFSPAALPGALYAATMAGLAAEFWMALRLHVFDTLRASGGGADSFPLVFAPATLAFCATVFGCACMLVYRWRHKAQDNSIATILCAVPLLAAAMGRSDPEHLLSNGLGMLAPLLLAASGRARLWRWASAGFFAAWVALPLAFNAIFLVPYVVRAARTTTPAPRALDLSALYAGATEVVEAPLGFKPNGWGTYLAPQVDYGFYQGLENANTPRAVARKIAELDAHPERAVLLPAEPWEGCSFDPAHDRRVLSMLLFSPYLARAEHLENPHEALCDSLRSRYRMADAPTAARFGYGLWVRR